MDYNEFLLKAQYDLAAAMPGAIISREQISKLQGESYEGFTVRSEGSMTGVVLNMEAMYERLEAGTDYNQILSDMLDIVDDNSTSVSHLLPKVTETEKQLHNYKQNRDYNMRLWPISRRQPLKLFGTAELPV